MYVVGLDIDSRAYFTSATCAISFLNLMNNLLFLHIFSIKYNSQLNKYPQRIFIPHIVGHKLFFKDRYKFNLNLGKTDNFIYTIYPITFYINKRYYHNKINYINNNNLIPFEYNNQPKEWNNPYIINIVPGSYINNTNNIKHIHLKYSYNYQKGIITRDKRNMLQINNYQKSMLIGILLSNGWIKRKKGWNSEISLKQSMKHFEYLWLVFCELSHLCSNLPYITKNLKKGKIFYSIVFSTRKLKCLEIIDKLFYTTKNNKKIINFELFYHMDYIVLAHWIMGNGSKRNNGFTLCTDRFTLKEVILLKDILYFKLNIFCTIHKNKDKYHLYINKIELKKFKYKLKPYMIDIFLYKIL